MNLLLEHRLSFDGFKLCSEINEPLTAAVRTAAGIVESIAAVLRFVSGATPAVRISRFPVFNLGQNYPLTSYPYRHHLSWSCEDRHQLGLIFRSNAEGGHETPSLQLGGHDH